MVTLDIAHLREQGQDMIIVPLARQPDNGQINAIQAGAHSAGLRGIVVPVWRSGRTFGFVAPSSWQTFFRSLTWEQIVASLNKQLTIY